MPNASQVNSTGPVQVDLGELALAVFGAHQLLEGPGQDGKPARHPKFGIERLRAIGDWEDQIPKRVKVILEPTDNTPEYEQPKSYRQLLDRLSSDWGPDQNLEMSRLFPHQASDVAGPFMDAAKRCWDYLRSVFPTQEYQTFAGPTTMVPDDDAVWSFFSVLWVIQDPLVVFDLIAIGAILDNQAVAFRAIYPTLSQAFDSAIYLASGNARAAKPSFQLPVQAEDGLAVWFTRELDVTDQKNDDLNKADTSQTQGSPVPGKDNPSNLQTKTQQAVNQ